MMLSVQRNLQLYKWIKAGLYDHPGRVDFSLYGLVLLHLLTCTRIPELDVLEPINRLAVGDAITLHLGITSLAAILAGFSGVIAVFALGSPGPRFTLMRRTGGAALERNWTWLAFSALTAAFIGLLGAIASALESSIAHWAFELALLLAVHAATRQIVLLRDLARIVTAQDRAEAKEAEGMDVRRIIGHTK